MNIKTRNKIKTEFSMSGLADVIFLLLIFFMLTSTLVSPNALKLFLPQSSSKTFAKQTVSVSITEDIAYFVDKDPVQIEQLAQKLHQVLKNQKDPTVILNTDKSVPIEHIVKVMDIANQMQYKLVLATNPHSD